jgi:hypothetical protein
MFTCHTGRNSLTFHDIVSVTDQNETNNNKKITTSVQLKNLWSSAQGAWHQDELIGGKSPVVK